MKIGTTSLAEPIDFLEEEESIVVEQVIAPEKKVRKEPNVVLKFKGFPPNCDPKDCVPTSEFPYMKSQVEYFNPIQSLFLKEVHKDNNIVACGSTSCGKTALAEMSAAYTLETIPGSKMAYVGPLKALISEKYNEWTNTGHSFSKYNISILTGDFSLTDERKKELAAADIICMSSEMLGSRVRKYKAEKNGFLNEIKIMVIDESHLLSSAGRGPAIEAALMKFTKLNPTCRIIFLSASMPNVDDLGQWLSKLNGKDTTKVISDYRPVDLDYHWETFESKGYYNQVEQSKIRKVIEIINKYKQDKFIIFVHTKKTGRMIMQMVRESGEDIEFHNADLKLDQRSRIEASFKSRESGSLRLIVATSTLAVGVNLPARRVIIVGLTRGMDMIEPLDVQQESGRSGRIGIDKKGDAHVLIRSTKMHEDISFCKTVLPVESKISDKNVLAFHMVSEIAEGNVKNKRDAVKWFHRSLSHHQGILETKLGMSEEVLVADVFSALEKCGAITLNDKKEYVATAIGKISSWFYVTPFDVADWKSNFKRIMSDGKKPSNIDIAWALGHTLTNMSEYEMKIKPGDLNAIVSGLIMDNKQVLGGADKHIGAINTILTGKESGTPEIDVLAVRYKMDAERIAQAVQMLHTVGGYFKDSKHEHIIYELPYRLNYGMGDACMELLVLPGIGAKTAKQIMGRSIFNAKQLLAAQTMGSKILTDAKWETVKRDVEQVALLGHVEFLKRKHKKHN